MPLTFRGHLRITFGVVATSGIKSYGEAADSYENETSFTGLL